MKSQILIWDHRESVDFESLNAAIAAVFDGQHAPRIHQIDTGSDCNAIVVAADQMTVEQVQDAWRTENDEE